MPAIFVRNDKNLLIYFNKLSKILRGVGRYRLAVARKIKRVAATHPIRDASRQPIDNQIFQLVKIAAAIMEGFFAILRKRFAEMPKTFRVARLLRLQAVESDLAIKKLRAERYQLLFELQRIRTDRNRFTMMSYINDIYWGRQYQNIPDRISVVKSSNALR